MPRKTSLNVF